MISGQVRISINRVGVAMTVLTVLGVQLLVLGLVQMYQKQLPLMLFVGCLICPRVVSGEINVYTPMYVQLMVADRLTQRVDIGNLSSQRLIKPNLVRDDNLFVEGLGETVLPENSPVGISMPSGVVPMSPVTACLDVWKAEMADDFDAEYVLKGIAEGFKLVDDNCTLDPCCCGNYRSTLDVSKPLVQEQIELELSKGRYIITKEAPHVVSALGAIPKGTTKIRLIHDLFRLSGKSVSFRHFCYLSYDRSGHSVHDFGYVFSKD
jgi:hypothetical protein